jgi:uncharacterized protein YciI
MATPNPELHTPAPSELTDAQRQAEIARLEQLHQILDAQIKESSETVPVPDAVAIHDEAMPDFGAPEKQLTPDQIAAAAAIQDLGNVISMDPALVKDVLAKSQIDPLASKELVPDDGVVIKMDPHDIMKGFYDSPEVK